LKLAKQTRSLCGGEILVDRPRLLLHDLDAPERSQDPSPTFELHGQRELNRAGTSPGPNRESRPESAPVAAELRIVRRRWVAGGLAVVCEVQVRMHHLEEIEAGHTPGRGPMGYAVHEKFDAPDRLVPVKAGSGTEDCRAAPDWQRRGKPGIEPHHETGSRRRLFEQAIRSSRAHPDEQTNRFGP
jgi:hypothetical protein